MGLRKAPNSSDPACQSSMDSAVVQTDLTPSKIWKMGKLIGSAPHILQSKTAFRLETSKCVKMLHTLLGEKLYVQKYAGHFSFLPSGQKKLPGFIVL